MVCGACFDSGSGFVWLGFRGGTDLWLSFCGRKHPRGVIVWIGTCLGAAKRSLSSLPRSLGCWETLGKKAFFSWRRPSRCPALGHCGCQRMLGREQFPTSSIFWCLRHTADLRWDCWEPPPGRGVPAPTAQPVGICTMLSQFWEFHATPGRTAGVSPVAEQAGLGVCREGTQEEVAVCRMALVRMPSNGGQCDLSRLWACACVPSPSIQWGGAAHRLSCVVIAERGVTQGRAWHSVDAA